MTWPFWAPTPHARIAQALDLADLRTGERFVDLGCGDGRVLLAAVQRGAVVTGIEIDADLAGQARRLLAVADVAGTVDERDFVDVDLSDADVVFAFLSPATLQRLVPTLERLRPGSRVVTTGFAVIPWEPTRAEDRCFLYRMPPRRVAAGRQPGWASPGVVAGVRAGASSLTSVELHHPAGMVTIRADGDLAGFVTLAQGADALDAPATVVVDLRWDARDAGVVAVGRLEAPGLASLAVFGVYTDGPTGVWGLVDDDACEQVARALADPTGSPEALLARARLLER